MNSHAARSEATLLAQMIQELTEATPFVDTHEHLWAESHRIASVDTPTDVHAPDFGMLLGSYAEGDLLVAVNSLLRPTPESKVNYLSSS